MCYTKGRNIVEKGENAYIYAFAHNLFKSLFLKVFKTQPRFVKS